MTDDRELAASITSEEQFHALDEETKQRLLKREAPGDGNFEAHAVFGEADHH